MILTDCRPQLYHENWDSSGSGKVLRIKHEINVNTQEELATTSLGLNSIGRVNLVTAQPVVFSSYEDRLGTWQLYLDR